MSDLADKIASIDAAFVREPSLPYVAVLFEERQKEVARGIIKHYGFKSQGGRIVNGGVTSRDEARILVYRA